MRRWNDAHHSNLQALAPALAQFGISCSQQVPVIGTARRGSPRDPDSLVVYSSSIKPDVQLIDAVKHKPSQKQISIHLPILQKGCRRIKEQRVMALLQHTTVPGLINGQNTIMHENSTRLAAFTSAGQIRIYTRSDDSQSWRCSAEWQIASTSRVTEVHLLAATQ